MKKSNFKNNIPNQPNQKNKTQTPKSPLLPFGHSQNKAADQLAIGPYSAEPTETQQKSTKNLLQSATSITQSEITIKLHSTQNLSKLQPNQFQFLGFTKISVKPTNGYNKNNKSSI
jgi:hypothetical protein